MASVVYTPSKLLFAGSGALLGLAASPNPRMSEAIFEQSLGGDYVVTARQVACGEAPEFRGREVDDDVEDAG